MAHSWDPDRYLTYADERGRPFVELLARIGADEPRTVVDLGCGPGNLTALLADRWPDASVTGLDSSPEMIERARTADDRIAFDVADLREWVSTGPTDDGVDVLVSNATLQCGQPPGLGGKHGVEVHANQFDIPQAVGCGHRPHDIPQPAAHVDHAYRAGTAATYPLNQGAYQGGNASGELQLFTQPLQLAKHPDPQGVNVPRIQNPGDRRQRRDDPRGPALAQRPQPLHRVGLHDRHQDAVGGRRPQQIGDLQRPGCHATSRPQTGRRSG